MSKNHGSEHERSPGEGSPARRKRRRKPQLPDVIKVDDSSERRESRRKQSGPPDTEACLTALGQLPGLIVMGLVKTAQANAIRGTYATILQEHHRSRTGREQPKLDDADVMKILRSDPSLLSMLESLLTDEQIATLMEQAGDGDDGET